MSDARQRPTPRRGRRAVRSGFFLLMVLAGFALTSCGAVRDDSGHPLTTLNPKGPESRAIDNLANPVFLVAGIVFVLIQGAVIFMGFRFRKRRNDDTPDPVQSHGAPRLEWAWTIAPAILLGILAINNVKTIWKLEERTPDTMSVTVVGQQWWWEYRYDLDNDGTIDIITPNQMVVPAGRQISLHIQSNDVIHSFWIPALNGKKDAVPGRTQGLAIEADVPGLYAGTCTEYCGLSHAKMQMEVKAVTTDEFAAWVKNQEKPAVTPVNGSEADAGMKLFQSRCSMCHQINQFDGDNNGALRTDLGIDTAAAPADASPSEQLLRATEIRSAMLGLDKVVPNPDYREGREELTSANAPNLTHLMTRNKFAGNLFDLYKDGEANSSELRNWLRDPSAMKPMNPDNRQGMPTLGLTEDEINKLVIYLTSLK